MKKILFAIAIVMTMGFCASAQSDSFFKVNNADDYDYRTGVGNEAGFTLPAGHGYDNDSTAPLGGGLLILTAFGAGYALRKRK